MAKTGSASKTVTTAVSQNQVPTVSTNKHREHMILIWFDLKMSSHDDAEYAKKRLDHSVSYTTFQTELKPCVTFIQSIKNEKIFLIIPGHCASDILPSVTDIRQIHCIFVFCLKKARCEHLAVKYPKIVGIYEEIDLLCTAIQEQIDSLSAVIQEKIDSSRPVIPESIDRVDEELQLFSFLDPHTKITQYLSKESAEFLWFQLFNFVLLRLPRNQQTKKQMIDICRQHYPANPEQQKLIDEFEQDYRPEEAIRWYFKQSFIYKMINNALRSEDINMLNTFRFFIADLSESLARERKKIVSGEKVLVFYRGLKLIRSALDKFKKNEGKLVSTNGFLSTSRSRSEELIFSKKPTKRSDVVAVLFEIQCNVHQLGERIVFADVTSFIDFPEDKVLFDLSTAFQIKSVRQEGDVWIIKMIATDDGRAIIQDYIKESYLEEEELSTAIMFGKVICDIGQYDKAQKYFESMLRKPDGEDLAWIEYHTGRVLDVKGEQKAAREKYDQAYERMMNSQPARIKDSACVLNNIGNIEAAQGKYDKALEFLHRALAIQEKYYPPGHVVIATTLNNIGNILACQGKYDEAFKLHQQALKLQKKHYSSDHVDIAFTLGCLGEILRTQEKYDEASKFHQQALKIQEKCYPSGHIDTANSLNSIAAILRAQGKNNEALEHLQRSLDIKEKCYPSAHVDIATTFNNMGLIFEDMDDSDRSLEYLGKAVRMKEQLIPVDHPSMATSFGNLASAYGKKGDYQHALEYEQKFLANREKALPPNDPVIGRSLSNIGDIYEKLNKAKMALDYNKRALAIYEQSLPIGHPARERTEKNIQRLSQGNCSLQ